jgi:hypothetical protein
MSLCYRCPWWHCHQIDGPVEAHVELLDFHDAKLAGRAGAAFKFDQAVEKQAISGVHFFGSQKHRHWIFAGLRPISFLSCHVQNRLVQKLGKSGFSLKVEIKNYNQKFTIKSYKKFTIKGFN